MSKCLPNLYVNQKKVYNNCMVICVYYENEVHIAWKAVPEAYGYMLYRKTDEHMYSSIKEVYTNSVSLFGMGNDEIKIKPFKIVNGKKEYFSKPMKFRLDKNYSEENFECITLSNKTNVNLLWKPITGANFYKIILNGKILAETNNNEYIAKLLPVGIQSFVIEAYNNNVLVKKSEKIPVNIKEMELFSINTDGQILLYWNKVPNVDGYRIFKKNEKLEFGGFQTANNEHAYVSEIVPDEIAEFKVKPFILEDGKRIFTGLSAKCKVQAYKNSHIDLFINEAYGNQLALSWLFDGDVDGYEIFRNNESIEKIEDDLAHISMLDFNDGAFQVKGYKKYLDEIIYTCQSDIITDYNYRLKQESPLNYKLSVIIPAYNSQDYISRSISTVLGSTIDSVELVLVDDGSSDNTREIISWYSEKYPDYVKKIFKQNGGVADTRNVGIEFAHGEYIAFMDNDDMIRPDGFRKLYEAIKNTNSDVAVAPLYRIDNDKYVTRHTLPFAENQAIDIEDYLRLIFSDSFNNIGVWNKLYKADLVKEHPFGLLMYEDVSWTPYILSYADKFCYVKDICYEWDRKIRSATFSHVLSNRSAEEKFKERFEAFEFFYKKGNPKRKECLAYLMAKRLYGQGLSAKYHKYFDAISGMKSELINNKFLLEDDKSCERILPLLKN